MKITFSDWLELLGLNEAVSDLLAGAASLSDTLEQVAAARDSYPGVSQDYLAVLDQLTPFFEKVEAAIVAQEDLVRRFNKAVGEFGTPVVHPEDHLLSAATVAEMTSIRDALFEQLDAKSREAELAKEAIEDVLKEIEELAGGLEEGDPFLEDAFQDLFNQLEETVQALEEQQCLDL